MKRLTRWWVCIDGFRDAWFWDKDHAIKYASNWEYEFLNQEHESYDVEITFEEEVLS